jgi:hypothetical protein
MQRSSTIAARKRGTIVEQKSGGKPEYRYATDRKHERQLSSYVQKVATEIAGPYVISSPHDAWMTRNVYNLPHYTGKEEALSILLVLGDCLVA